MASYSAVQFRALAPGKTISVGEGLYLFGTSGGGKSWRYKPRVGGKRITVTFGHWPDVSLDEARDGLRAAKKQIKAGLHPTVEKKVAKAAKVSERSNTFGALYTAWFDEFGPSKSAAWRDNQSRWYARFLAPVCGGLPVASVSAPMIHAAMEAAKTATSLHAAHSVRQLAVTVLDRGVALGKIPQNPARSLKSVMAAHTPEQMAAMTLEQARALNTRIDDYEGTPQMRAALKLLLHTALRVSEVANIERSWLVGDTLVIPRVAMKVKSDRRGDFVVPLSRQAREAVQSALDADTSGRYLFGGFGTRKQPISRSAFNRAFVLMQMGAVSPHSVRNAFSTWAHETEAALPPVVEAALDHARGSATAQAYNRGSLLAQRAHLMQAWSDAISGAL